jgi:hypothetical protein
MISDALISIGPLIKRFVDRLRLARKQAENRPKIYKRFTPILRRGGFGPAFGRVLGDGGW